MTYPIVELPFEEVGLMLGGVECGMFSGTAHIDPDGAVVEIDLDGYKHGLRTTSSLKVPFRHGDTSLFTAKIAIALADRIETLFAPDIKAMIDDWIEGARHREFALEPAE